MNTSVNSSARGSDSGWTKEEDRILIERYSREGLKGCAAKIPSRSLEQIRQRVNRLGLTRSFKSRDFSDVDNAAEPIADMAATTPTQQLECTRREMLALEDRFRHARDELARIHKKYAIQIREIKGDINHQRRVS